MCQQELQVGGAIPVGQPKNLYPQPCGRRHVSDDTVEDQHFGERWRMHGEGLSHDAG